MLLYRTRRIQQALCGLFLADPGRAWHATDLWRTAGVNSGGLYIVLAQMENAGWIESGFDDEPPPRRRSYRPTRLGVDRMRETLLGGNWIGKRKSS